MEFIIIGVFVLVFAYIGILYLINSRKQKNKSTKVEKPEVKEDVAKKIELKSEIIKEKPVETALSEATIEYEINEAIQKTSEQTDIFEETNKKPGRVGRLQVDRSDFVSTRRSRQSSNSTLSNKTLKSETAVIGVEGPSKETQEPVKRDVEDTTSQKTIADEINNMSPEVKAILINDILNKKY